MALATKFRWKERNLSDLLATTDSLEVEVPDDLDLVRETRAAKVVDLVREFVALDEEDLDALRTVGPEHSTPSLRHVRAYHHIIALRLATGERPGVIAAALGIKPATVSVLQNDPQFQATVEAYRGEVVAKAVDHTEIMSAVSFEALTALHERLISEERDEIPLESLRRIAETVTDRIGLSPVRRSESAHHFEHSLSKETLERVKTLHSEDATYRKGSWAPATDAEAVPAPSDKIASIRVLNQGESLAAAADEQPAGSGEDV